MKAAQALKPNVVTLSELDIPAPGSGEIVLQVKSSLVSCPDIRAARAGNQTALGHEVSGIVYDADPKTGFKKGDAVIVPTYAGCGTCPDCQEGHAEICLDFETTGIKGALAEYALVPARVAALAEPKPDNVSFTAAAFISPLASVMHGLSLVPLHDEDRVLIFGSGCMALLYMLVVKHISKAKVFIAAPEQGTRLNNASKLGADKVFDINNDFLEKLGQETLYKYRIKTEEGFEVKEGPHKAELVIDCAGTVESLNLLVKSASKGSHILINAGGPGGMSVDTDAGSIHYDQMHIHASRGYTAENVKAACRLLAEGFDPTAIITGTLPLADIAKAFAADKSCPVKYEIVP
ncbi:MAG: alcohol dehydrogenase catalytic domain-containing protein [bacterium]|nr:alcohol dehydrogenase catalytic domain-containing protein [bacterium]